MKEDKTRRKTMMKDLFGDLKVTRRSFMKRASAATGGAIALGGTFKPTLRSLAEASETTDEEPGNGRRPPVRDVRPGVPSRCTSLTGGR